MAKLKRVTDEQRMALYRQGLNDSEIAAKLHTTQTAIGNWRKRQGLTSNASIAQMPVQRVFLGDRINFTPTAFTDRDGHMPDGTVLPARVSGTVTWIHPKRRFYLVVADAAGGTVRECFKLIE